MEMGEIAHHAWGRRLRGCSQPPSHACELPPHYIKPCVEPFGSLKQGLFPSISTRTPADGVGLAMQPSETPWALTEPACDRFAVPPSQPSWFSSFGSNLHPSLCLSEGSPAWVLVPMKAGSG